ncbi:hypothetical protein [uncultured Croceitalea sp.]|uniref:hypothetical protein n=1 Tax=uncultured Croceitalea sp. TaxID=1798908 RepID=UPI0033060C9D
MFFLLTALFSVQGQSKIGYASGSERYSEIGKEKVFLHHNSSMLFVGEYLYYSLYCLNDRTKNLSDISKIAYVELVGEKQNVVFKQKINLSDGLGEGDFFIPVSVPSGNYKLIAYTKWMKNWGIGDFYQSNLVILNPYTNAQKTFLSDALTQSADTTSQYSSKKPSTSNKINYLNIINLGTDKNVYRKREKVSLNLRSLRNNLIDMGNYSLSVRKVNELNNSSSSPIMPIGKVFEESSSQPIENMFFLPELRGNLVSGKIVAIDSSSIVKNQKVIFSVPEKNYQLRVVTTNERGEFYFSLDETYEGENGMFQVWGNNSEGFKILLDDETSIDYANLSFDKFRLEPAMKETIAKRSIHNQIENAYFSKKPDTIRTIEKQKVFSGENVVSYLLDDYTRFPTVKETFVEVVSDVWISEGKNSDEYAFTVRGVYSSDYQTAYKPLIIVDGIVLQDFKSLMDYGARKIKTVNVVRNKYVIGAQIFQGIIDIETFDNDFNLVMNNANVKTVVLDRPSAKKKYFKQVYTEEQIEDYSVIPDFRHQLLWQPNIQFEGESMEIEFYTSDVSGAFEITLEGYTLKGGEPVSLRKIIKVE